MFATRTSTVRFILKYQRELSSEAAIVQPHSFLHGRRKVSTANGKVAMGYKIKSEASPEIPSEDSSIFGDHGDPGSSDCFEDSSEYDSES